MITLVRIHGESHGVKVEFDNNNGKLNKESHDVMEPGVKSPDETVGFSIRKNPWICKMPFFPVIPQSHLLVPRPRQAPP